MHALNPANWWRIKIVVKGNGIIKNCNFSKMEGPAKMVKLPPSGAATIAAVTLAAFCPL
jgi:hypothetical protein